MALADASSPVSRTAVALENMLNATHAWSNLSGAMVHHNHLPPPSALSHSKAELVGLRPYALIWTADNGYRVERDTVNGDDCFMSSGNLMIEIQRNVPTGEDYAEADRSFENLWGAIMASGNAAEPGLMELAGQLEHLPIRSIQHLESTRTAPDKVDAIGDAQRVFLHLHWSMG
ncbi:MAG: hypothetical protein AAFX06_21365 [Planctomycetota bacterium]